MRPIRTHLSTMVLLSSLAVTSAACPRSSSSGRQPQHPEVYQVEPACGWEAGWDEVRIFTRNFQDDFLVDPPDVTFGVLPAQSVTALSATNLLAVTPDGMTPGFVDVTVTSTGVVETASCPGCFEVTAAPFWCRIIDWYPRSSPPGGGQEMTIRGGPFDPSVVVIVGGLPAPNLQLDPTRTILTFESPPGIPSGPEDVMIVDSMQTCTLPGIYYYQSDGYCSDVRVFPSADDVAGGTTVTITGVGFDVGPDPDPIVEFGTTGNWVLSPNVTNLQDGSTLLAEVPAWPMPGLVEVRVTNRSTGSSCSTSFEFVSAPGCALMRIGPNTGPICGGNIVTLTGLHLDPAPVEIWFGSAHVDPSDPTQFVWIDPGTALVKVPAYPGSGGGDVTYVNPGPNPCTLTGAYSWR